MLLVLGLIIAVQQRRETRLKAALARFQNRAHQEIYSSLNDPVIDSGSPRIQPLAWGSRLSLDSLIGQISLLINRPFFTRSRFAMTSRCRLRFPSGSRSVAAIDRPNFHLRARRLKSPFARFSVKPLEPIGLACQVKDGTVTITSQGRHPEQLHKNILKQLDQPMNLSWSDQDSLRDVVERVRFDTQGPDFPQGLPIFVQLVGPDSPGDRRILLEPIEERIPIRAHLKWILEPMGLCYELKDGAVMIVNQKDLDEPSSFLLGFDRWPAEIGGKCEMRSFVRIRLSTIAIRN